MKLCLPLGLRITILSVANFGSQCGSCNLYIIRIDYVGGERPDSVSIICSSYQFIPKPYGAAACIQKKVGNIMVIQFDSSCLSLAFTRVTIISVLIKYKKQSSL